MFWSYEDWLSVRGLVTDDRAYFMTLTSPSPSRVPQMTDWMHFQMRAQNQQDLIYKRGQAGVTKASVTIVFDNSDREKSPVGLEHCRQITVTRQVRPCLTVFMPPSTDRSMPRLDIFAKQLKVSA